MQRCAATSPHLGSLLGRRTTPASRNRVCLHSTSRQKVMLTYHRVVLGLQLLAGGFTGLTVTGTNHNRSGPPGRTKPWPVGQRCQLPAVQGKLLLLVACIRITSGHYHATQLPGADCLAWMPQSCRAFMKHVLMRRRLHQDWKEDMQRVWLARAKAHVHAQTARYGSVSRTRMHS